MSDLIQILRDSLPEAIGGLTVAAILAIFGILYKRASRSNSKKTGDKDITIRQNFSQPNVETGKTDSLQAASAVSNLSPLGGRVLNQNSHSDDLNRKTQIAETQIHGRPTILFVDDEIRGISAYMRALEKEGFEIVVAASSSEAIHIIKSEKSIDLAVVDLMLPSGDEKEGKVTYEGLKVIEVARKWRTEMPVICLSAAVGKNLEYQLLKLGVGEHIRKPVAFTECIYRIKLAILLRQQPHPHELILEEISNRRLELKGADPYTRIRALWALGELGHHDPNVVNLLKEIEVNDKDPEVRVAAKQARQKIQKRLRQKVD